MTEVVVEALENGLRQWTSVTVPWSPYARFTWVEKIPF